MKTVLSITTVFLLFVVLHACSKDGGGGNGGGTDCSAVTNKAFNADVNPIIQGRCNQPGCHATGSTNGPGPLTTYNEVFNARTQIRSAVNAGTMPQGSALTTSQKNSIICWIDSGAPNN